MRILEEWRDATRAEHERLEAELGFFRDDFTRADYARVLAGFQDFYAAFEPWIRDRAIRTGQAAATFYWPDRAHRLDALAEDLAEQAIGFRPGAQSPARRGTSSFDAVWPTDANLWGALYVIEGSSLGGQVISRRVQERGWGGCRFFQGYGDQTASRWRAFLARAAELDGNEIRTREAVAGAVAAFKELGDCLRRRAPTPRPPSPPPP